MGGTDPLEEDVPAFVRIGLDPNADAEDLYTVDCLMGCVGLELLGDAYYESLDARIDERRKPDYKPQIDRALVRRAWELLHAKDWIGLQNINAEKKIRSLKPLAGLVNAKTISAAGNLIEDLEPLRGLASLSTLYLSGNPIRSVAPLAGCLRLRKLEVDGTRVSDLSPLQALPELEEMDVDSELLTTCKVLPALRYLRGSGERISASNLPKLPALQSLDMGFMDLHGLDACGRLQNLTVSSSERAVNLDPLGLLSRLTHLRINAESSEVDLAPLARAYALREVIIFAKKIRGRDALEVLPALREARLVLPGVKYVDSRLPLDNQGWEAEFKAERPTSVPSLEVEIVSDSDFERFDMKEPYGVEDWDGNRAMLESERAWILKEIEEALRVDFAEEDIVLPWKGGRRRSDTVCIYSRAAAEQTRSIVTRIQHCLSWSRHPWIIYFQSSFFEGDDMEGPDFIAWVYPDKIVTTKESWTALEPWLKW